VKERLLTQRSALEEQLGEQARVGQTKKPNFVSNYHVDLIKEFN